MSHERLRFGLVAAALGVSVLFYVRLPAFVGTILMPDLGGIAMSFTIPLAALATILIFKSLVKRDPLRANYARFRRTYEISLDLAVALAVGTHLLLLGWFMIVAGARGARTHIGLWISYVPTSLIGIVLIVAGNIMPRLRPNNVIGIRTRWTLGNETVWMKTHRAGGYFLVFFGLTLMAWTFIDFMSIWWVLGSGAVLAVAGLPLLSRVIAKRDRRSSSPLSGGGARKEEVRR